MNRQKFIRMLGLVSLVDLVLGKKRAQAKNDALAVCRTQTDQEGPFYKSGAPLRAIIEKEGTLLEISGRIFDGGDCTTPVSNALLDIWHCDNQGAYDMTGYKCRGQIKTDAQGKFNFTTIYPPSYGNRPRHVHVKVHAKGYRELTTQIYFRGDPAISNDFARNAEETRVISLTEEKRLKKGVFNIYL